MDERMNAFQKLKKNLAHVTRNACYCRGSKKVAQQQSVNDGDDDRAINDDDDDDHSIKLKLNYYHALKLTYDYFLGHFVALSISP